MQIFGCESDEVAFISLINVSDHGSLHDLDIMGNLFLGESGLCFNCLIVITDEVDNAGDAVIQPLGLDCQGVFLTILDDLALDGIHTGVDIYSVQDGEETVVLRLVTFLQLIHTSLQKLLGIVVCIGHLIEFEIHTGLNVGNLAALKQRIDNRSVVDFVAVVCKPQTLILGIHIVLNRLGNIRRLRGDEEQTLRREVDVFRFLVVDLIGFFQGDADLFILQIHQISQASGVGLIDDVEGTGQVDMYLILCLGALTGGFDDLIQGRITRTFHLGRLVNHD